MSLQTQQKERESGKAILFLRRRWRNKPPKETHGNSLGKTKEEFMLKLSRINRKCIFVLILYLGLCSLFLANLQAAAVVHYIDVRDGLAENKSITFRVGDKDIGPIEGPLSQQQLCEYIAAAAQTAGFAASCIDKYQVMIRPAKEEFGTQITLGDLPAPLRKTSRTNVVKVEGGFGDATGVGFVSITIRLEGVDYTFKVEVDSGVAGKPTTRDEIIDAMVSEINANNEFHAAKRDGNIYITSKNGDKTVRNVSASSASTKTPRGIRVVYAIQPDRGPTTGGTECTLYGNSLEHGALISFGSTEATVLNFDSTDNAYSVSTPPGHGTVDVILVMPGDTATYESTLFMGYTYTSREPSHTQWSLILLILAVAGFFGYVILRRRNAIISVR